jgi:hypothetical protein
MSGRGLNMAWLSMWKVKREDEHHLRDNGRLGQILKLSIGAKMMHPA